MKIPDVKPRPFYDRNVAGPISAAVVAASALVVTWAGSPPAPGGPRYVAAVALLGVAITFVVGFRKALREDRATSGPRATEAIEDWLRGLHAALLASKGQPANDSTFDFLRATIHKVVSDREVMQIVPYVGGKGGDVGRTFNLACGVVGQACTSETKVGLWHRTDGDLEAYKATLRKLHMPPKEIANVRPDRMSMLAVALSNEENEPLLVVFFDAKDQNFFTTETVTLITYALSGLAKLVEIRYGK